jgi:hypothetical protein
MIVRRVVVPVHRDADQLRTPPARQDRAVRSAAPRVDPGNHSLESAPARQRRARVEEAREALLAARSRANRAELDEARAAPGLGARAAMADGEAVGRIGCTRHHHVAEVVLDDVAYLARQVEAGLSGVPAKTTVWKRGQKPKRW